MKAPTNGPSLQPGQHPAREGLPSVRGVQQTPLPEALTRTDRLSAAPVIATCRCRRHPDATPTQLLAPIELLTPIVGVDAGVGVAIAREVRWLIARSPAAPAKHARPIGPIGGGCDTTTTESPRSTETITGARTRRYATTAAITAVAHARTPMMANTPGSPTMTLSCRLWMASDTIV